jgi:ribose 5-phosphate isomerase B
MEKMKILFGSDPNATGLKAVLIDHVVSLGHEAVDLGSDDPIYASVTVDVAEAIAAGKGDRGVVLCGTGIGVSIAANKVRGVSCALLTDTYQAERAQLSNCANVVAFGAQVTGPELAKTLLRTYLQNSYQRGGRSDAKNAAIRAYENAQESNS